MLFCSYRGTQDIVSPYGIPRDLLDRLLTVKMKPYSCGEMMEIIRIRATTEGISIDEDALQELSDTAERTSLRWEKILLFSNIYHYIYIFFY